MTSGDGVSRRQVFGAAAAGTVAAGALVAGAALGRQQDEEPAADTGRHPFHGDVQSGILTPVQDRMHFAAFDVADGVDRDGLVALLRDWTAAAALMTQGEPAGRIPGHYDMPPADTGEAVGLPPSHLTITFGFGPSLFGGGDGETADRFGLAHRRPAGLARLPHFTGDNLRLEQSDGDLCVQACADDPQVAVHAIRNLTRIAFGRAVLRWSQLGFGRTSSTSVTQDTPRNLFGFKDGTMGLRAEASQDVARHVLVPEGDGAGWLGGGSYLVARKISMRIETWDRSSLREQERVVGRTKAEGAPLSGGTEFSQPDFSVLGRGDVPLVARDSHVGIAHPDHNNGVKLLRRGYNFVDGNDSLGRLSAGLFFITFVTDPRTHYIPMQSTMSQSDLMQEYLQHVGSGLWACPPGIRDGEFVGERLFA